MAKRMEPFKMYYVPSYEIRRWQKMNPVLWNMVYKFWCEYHSILDDFIKGKGSRKEVNNARKRLLSRDNAIVDIFYSMLQLEFNYSEATIRSGSLLLRMVKIYEGAKNIMP